MVYITKIIQLCAVYKYMTLHYDLELEIESQAYSINV